MASPEAAASTSGDDRWLTFDCFGTLIDWRHGIRTTSELIFPGAGDRLLAAYHAVEADIQAQKPFKGYREVLAQGFRRAAASLSLELLDDDAAALGETLPHWPPFADVAPALERCRAAGFRLAILTNCDRDLIARTLRHLPVPFDAVVTAEDVQAYKPNVAHFRHFESVRKISRDRWIHVAQSYFHDIKPAHALGLRSIWINRLGEREDESIATATLPGLARLPEVLGI
jgi:2-haloacid dehalogenase